MASTDHPGREVVVFPGSVSSHIRARCGGWDGGTFNVLAGDKVAADLHDAPTAVGLIRRGGLRDGTARFQKGGFREDDALFLHQVVPVHADGA